VVVAPGIREWHLPFQGRRFSREAAERQHLSTLKSLPSVVCADVERKLLNLMVVRDPVLSYDLLYVVLQLLLQLSNDFLYGHLYLL
jgi:c-di-GMP-related signal transduction protein